MPSVTRKGDLSTGHDSCAATALEGGSPDVLANGMPVGRAGDAYAPHSCAAHASHADVVSGGSSSVFCNGLPVARVGDPVSLAGSVAGGSPDVLAGG